MSTNRLVYVSLKLLKSSGMDPRDMDIITILKRFAFILVNLLSYADFLLILFLDWKGFDSIPEVTIYISFAHVGYKLSSLMVKRQHYISIFHTMNNFTQWESLQGEIKEEVDRTVKLFSKLIKGFEIICVMAGFGYTLSPLLITSKRTTPLETHFSKYYDNTVIFVIAYLVHTLDFFLAVLTILGHDSLFVSIVTSIDIEIRIIKYRIKNMMVDDADVDGDKVEEISKIVAQHNLVLKVIKECNIVYSDVLLVQFLSSIVFLSTALVCMLDSGFPPPPKSVLTFGLHLSASMFQLFIFCTLGQVLINQAQSISAAIYNIKWWIKPQPKLRQACLLMIQRANKLDCLTAAGMFILNYESYMKVLKFGLSLFSLTQAMKTRNSHF